jgi:pimeloyl-ACP methyl ester carboxylesterase
MMSASMERIREESLWFSTADRPLFGRLTIPKGNSAFGGVLLAPPIGRESRQARRALRSLAHYLAIDGYASLRYDHFGTGDSSGSLESDEFDHAWIEGVDQGVLLLRSLGIASISAVGMRMGATIVGTAAATYDLGLSSFVMWDPCESGQSYTREINALGALRQNVITDDSGAPTKMLEYPLSDAATNRIKRFTLLEPPSRPTAGRVLVVVRVDRAISQKFRARWSTEEVAWTTNSEQGPMLEAQLPSTVQPTATIADIRAWLTRNKSASLTLADTPRTRDAIVMKGSNAFPVKESVVELGPHGLFGVVSEPEDGPRGPLIVMVNGVNEDHVGPARLWVELSRQWAGLGLRCLRFDPYESGESPWLSNELQADNGPRPQDVRDAVGALNPSISSDAVLIGFCNGARLALEVSLELKTRGVCAINPQVGTGVFLHVDRLETSDRDSVRPLVRRADNLRDKYQWADKLIHRILDRLVKSEIGNRAWLGALKLSSACPPRVRSALAESDTDALLIISPEDLSTFRRIPIIGRVLRRREASSENYRVEIIPELDHAFLSVLGRSRAVAILSQHIIERFTETAD